MPNDDYLLLSRSEIDRLGGNSLRPRGILLILGMHRSGTSLCSQLLSTFGMDMTDDVSINDSNPHGHWERLELVNFHNRIFTLLNRDWYGPTHAYALPRAWWADPKVRAIRDEMIAWLRTRMSKSQSFGFKDPRTSRLLPLWREICAELGLRPHFVLCVRHPTLVARSLIARKDLVEICEGEHRWLVYNVEALASIDTQSVCILPYED